ncbi:MAG: phosphatase PAP2 family protein [Candidatus Neomarinimicrobiota bacterium]
MFSDLYKKFKAGAFPADSLVLGFSTVMLMIGIWNYSRLGHPYTAISTNIGIIFLLMMLIAKENYDVRRPFYWLHFTLPLFTLAFYYTQCAAWDNLIFINTFDPLLMKWDTAIFGRALNLVLAPAVNSQFVDELMHGFYVSYYLIVFVPALLMLKRNRSHAFELVFSLILMMYIHFLFFMVFPGDGPIPDRSHLFGRGTFFIPLENFIYRASEQNGGGAFPSTHVSCSILVLLYSLKYLPKWRIPICIFCAGIVLATVYCSYHYAIDSAAGIVTGTLFFFIGQYVYARWRHPVDLPVVILPQNV